MKDSTYYTRHLPHWCPPGAIFFVTFNIRGALPMQVVRHLRYRAAEIREMTRKNPADLDVIIQHKKLFKYMDDELDVSGESCYLKKPELASVVKECIYRGKQLGRFRLHRYCIMPNHTHLLLEPLPDVEASAFQNLKTSFWPPFFWTDEGRQSVNAVTEDPQWHQLTHILEGLKGASARGINKLLKKTGPFWNQESYDHWVRDEAEYHRIVDYIDKNPVKAGLCRASAEFPWCSAGEK